MAKRSLRTAIAFVLALTVAGAMTSVGLSWVLAWAKQEPADPQPWNTALGQSWPIRVPAHWTAPSTSLRMSDAWRDFYQGISTPGRQTGQRGGPQYILVLSRYGWPMRSMQMQVWHDRPSADYSRYSLSLQGATEVPVLGLTSARARWLPTLVAWDGLAINTIFYAMLWGTAIVLPGAIRTRFKPTPGLCERCGYQVEALPICPECGHAQVVASRRDA